MIEQEPDLVFSSEGGNVQISGYNFSIEIYRLEDEAEWTLEVVDEENASHVWDDTFKTAIEARQMALSEIKQVGAKGFMYGHNVLPFRHPRG